MKTIHVQASRAYDVAVGGGALNLLGETARRAARSRTAMVVSETTVFPLYGAKPRRPWSRPDLRSTPISFPPGSPARTARNFCPWSTIWPPAA